MSKIEWTDETWNPTTGCDKVSAGCDNCYALPMAKRLKAMGQPKYQTDGSPLTSGPGFGLSMHKGELDRPTRWIKPRRVFVNSMSDLFHPGVSDEFCEQVWRVMKLADAHTFQVLTKRPQRMAKFVANYRDQSSATIRAGSGEVAPLGNVWLGTSIENDRYTWRANHLRVTPAVVRFLSVEPLLGPVPSLDLAGIDWVIVGGESGPGARPMKLEWVRDVRNACLDAEVPLFFKQWGAFNDSGDRVGKKRSGRLLDGRTWDQFPTRTSTGKAV